MKWFLASLVCAGSLLAQSADDRKAWEREKLDPRLKAVEDYYNAARSLTVEFEQTFLVRGRGARTETGVLSLMKPGRMRWDYREPAGKVLVADGKNVYYYNPKTPRVEKTSLKSSDDLRTPLAFLLGRLKFLRDFEDLRLTDTRDGLEVMAYPKTDLFEAEKVTFLVQQKRIVRIVITNVDQSLMSFSFTNERLNAPMTAEAFRYVPPKGIEIVEVKGFGVE